MKAIVVLTFGASCLLLLSACASPDSQPKTVTVDEHNNKKSVELIVGDQLEITLAGNPTTGYEWMLKQVDEAILKPDGDPEFSTHSEALGAGGIYSFKLDAIAAGETRVDLVYRRSFEAEDILPADEFSIMVTVK